MVPFLMALRANDKVKKDKRVFVDKDSKDSTDFLKEDIQIDKNLPEV